MGGVIKNLRLGDYTLSLRSPGSRPLFTERNRVHCRVLPLGFGWRLVWHWHARKINGRQAEAETQAEA